MCIWLLISEDILRGYRGCIYCVDWTKPGFRCVQRPPIWKWMWYCGCGQVFFVSGDFVGMRWDKKAWILVASHFNVLPWSPAEPVIWQLQSCQRLQHAPRLLTGNSGVLITLDNTYILQATQYTSGNGVTITLQVNNYLSLSIHIHSINIDKM